MAESNTIKEFISILGESSVTADPSELAGYSVDGVVPKAVAFPENEEQISEIITSRTALYPGASSQRCWARLGS